MKNKLLVVAVIGGLLLVGLIIWSNSKTSSSSASASTVASAPASTASPAAAPAAATAASAPAPSPLQAQMQALVAKINAKLQAATGPVAEKDLGPELQEFDGILAAHKGEKTDDMAQVTLMKNMLYLQVFEEPEKALALFKQLAQDFPDTPTGKKIIQALPDLEKQVAEQVAAEAIKKTLVVGAAFPDFQAQDLDGQPLSVGKYKGKVVLVDFWATWCGPCVAEMPNVIKTYAQYHDKGLEIIGVSLDNPGDKDKVVAFVKDNKITWAQIFDDGKNELPIKYGIEAIPANFLIGPDGKIIGSELRGAALPAAVGAALAGK